VAAADRDAATRAEPERRSDLTKERDVGLAYNQFWWDRGTSDGRTALIVDPGPAVERRFSRPQASLDARRLPRLSEVLDSLSVTWVLSIRALRAGEDGAQGRCSAVAGGNDVCCNPDYVFC
jgi:hypothetical protein